MLHQTNKYRLFDVYGDHYSMTKKLIGDYQFSMNEQFKFNDYQNKSYSDSKDYFCFNKCMNDKDCTVKCEKDYSNAFNIAKSNKTIVDREFTAHNRAFSNFFMN